jgi:hypothetical protein
LGRRRRHCLSGRVQLKGRDLVVGTIPPLIWRLAVGQGEDQPDDETHDRDDPEKDPPTTVAGVVVATYENREAREEKPQTHDDPEDDGADDRIQDARENGNQYSKRNHHQYAERDERPLNVVYLENPSRIASPKSMCFNSCVSQGGTT